MALVRSKMLAEGKSETEIAAQMETLKVRFTTQYQSGVGIVATTGIGAVHSVIMPAILKKKPA